MSTKHRWGMIGAAAALVCCMGAAAAQTGPEELQELRKEFDKFRIWMDKSIGEKAAKEEPPEPPLTETLLLTFQVDRGSEPVVVATAVPSYELRATERIEENAKTSEYEIVAAGRVQELETADVARAAFSGQPVPADQMPLLITCSGHFRVREQDNNARDESMVDFDASVIVRPGVESVLIKQGDRRLTVTVQLASRMPEANLEESE